MNKKNIINGDWGLGPIPNPQKQALDLIIFFY